LIPLGFVKKEGPSPRVINRRPPGWFNPRQPEPSPDTGGAGRQKPKKREPDTGNAGRREPKIPRSKRS